MRHPIVLLLLFCLIYASVLPALDTRVYDLPHLVRHAQTIVIGRVVQLTEVNAPDANADVKHAVIATITVKQLLQGTPIQQLHLVVRPLDEDVVLVGHEYLFFLKSYDSSSLHFFAPWLGGHDYLTTFGQFHFPHPIIPVDDNRMVFTDEVKGTYLADVIGEYADVEILKELITLIHGPLMTITAPEKPLSWGKQWTLDLHFSNPSKFPIPLQCAVPDAPINGTVIFIDKNGFSIGSAMCPLRLSGDQPQLPTVTIPAGGTLNGSITVTKPMIYLTGDPSTIRHMYVMHQSLTESTTLATGWNDSIIADLAMSFTTTNGETDALARSSSLLFTSLYWCQTEPDQEPALQQLSINVTPCRFAINESGSPVGNISSDEQTTLINALQWEQNGGIVRPARSGPALTALINRLVQDGRSVQPIVSKSDLAALVKPGNYTLRLILPHDNEQALSNVLHVTIP